MTEDMKKLLLMHKEYFISAYSDLTAFTVQKDLGILIEIENAFAHMMKYLHDEAPAINIQKATGHIYRATLDCYKLMWERLYEPMSVIDEYREAYEGDELTLLTDLRDMNNAVQKARKKECEEVGGEEIDVLHLWREAVTKAIKIHASINKTKLKKAQVKKRLMNPFYMIGVPSIFFVLGLAVDYFLL